MRDAEEEIRVHAAEVSVSWMGEDGADFTIKPAAKLSNSQASDRKWDVQDVWPPVSPLM